MSDKIEFEAEMYGAGSYEIHGEDVRTLNFATDDMSICPDVRRFRVTLEPIERELMPCPFCGGEAEAADNLVTYAVKCKNPDCAGMVGWFRSPAEATAAWHTRTDDDA